VHAVLRGYDSAPARGRDARWLTRMTGFDETLRK
jgi:hypothetical protein